MQVVMCSDYLYSQELANRVAAEQMLQMPSERHAAHRVFWKRLLDVLLGRTGTERRHEQAYRRAWSKAYMSEASRWHKGRLGEELLTNALAHQLDNRFLLLRNYTPPPPWRTGGDIDAVLLGPHGVTVFEVKAWNGDFRHHGGEWWYRPADNRPWEPARSNPTVQAQRNAQRIRNTLALASLRHVPVRPLVAMAEPSIRLELIPPLDVFILFVSRLADHMEAVVGMPSPGMALPHDVSTRVYQTLARGFSASTVT